MKVEIIKILESNGWEYLRTKGDHRVILRKVKELLFFPEN